MLVDHELAWDSNHGAAFNRQESQLMILTHKKPSKILPIINLDDFTLNPQPSVKWVGVIVDPKLTFSQHIATNAAKGVKVDKFLSFLARTNWGIPCSLCKHLIFSLVFTQKDYAWVVWNKYRVSPTSTATLQRVENTAHQFSPGAFKTHSI